MYSREDRMQTVELYIKYDKGSLLPHLRALLLQDFQSLGIHQKRNAQTVEPGTDARHAEEAQGWFTIYGIPLCLDRKGP